MAYDSATEIIQETLAELGLASLAGRLWDRYKETGSLEQVFFELRETPEYKARFAGLDTLRKKGRAISEAAYIEYERQAARLFHSAGLPEGFYDEPGDFAGWIGGEVSLAELQGRVEMARVAAFESPPELRDEFERLYGVGAGGLTALFLDPDRALPLIQQQFLSAQIGTAARRSDFGALTRGEAERLAQEGVTADRAAEGFGVLAESEQLFDGIGAEDDISRDEQLGGVFGGSTAAQQRIERRARQRASDRQAASGYGVGRRGVTGLG